MIRRLRIRFVRIAMAALTLAMVLVTSVINGANWYYAQRDMTQTAAYISENGGMNPSGGGRGKGQKHMSRETRYFSVARYGEDQYAALNMASIASVTESDALTMAASVVATGRESGFWDNFTFCVREKGGRTVVTFVDCETRIASLRSLAVISLAACAVAILLALALVSLLSRRAIRPLVESTEKQKRFITDAGHELKTPLTVISANMDVLAMDMGENEWIAATQRQVAGLRGLVNDLVALAKADETDASVAMEKFSLSDAVAETASGFAAIAERAGKTLETSVAPRIWTTGDEAAIRRLASILLDNAVKYAPESDRVALTLTLEGRRARLATENACAAPVDAAALDRLFDRFYRADPARARENGRGGYGLGLSIARATVEKHGGRAQARMRGDRLVVECLLPAFIRPPSAEN